MDDLMEAIFQQYVEGYISFPSFIAEMMMLDSMGSDEWLHCIGEATKMELEIEERNLRTKVLLERITTWN